jgi:hypothetical protein
MVEGRKAVDFHQFDCKKPKAWPLHPLHYDQSPKTIKILNAYFLTKVRTLKGSLGRAGMKIQTMVERPSIFFHKEINH